MNSPRTPLPEVPKVTVRYWAAARAAAGVAEEAVQAGSLAEALAVVRQRHPEPAMHRLLDMCSLLLDGQPVNRRDPTEVPLRDGTTLEVLPPFAGG